MISSLADFVSQASQENHGNDHSFFWRGHSDISYKLVPGIYRRKVALSAKEHLIIKEAFLRHPDEFSSHSSLFQKLAMLQHYEFPTRLLDITENPLVALYFACKESHSKDGEVILFKIKRDVVKYYDSDAIAILSAIAAVPSDKFFGFNDELKSRIIQNQSQHLSVLRDRISKNTTQTAITTLTRFLSNKSCSHGAKIAATEVFNECQLISALLHEVKSEKPHFQPRICPSDFNNSMICVKSPLDNKRIAAQQGAFLIFGVRDGDKSKPSDFEGDERQSINLHKITIPRAAKRSILKSLANFGISDERMFPEMMSSAKAIKEKLNF